MSSELQIKNHLISRKCELEKLIQCIEKNQKRFMQEEVEGYLEIHKDKHRYRYYITQELNEKKISPKKRTRVRTYIDQDRIDVARKIAMRDYSRDLYKLACNELVTINTLLELYEKDTIDNYFDQIHPGRRQLCTPILLSDDAYEKEWLKNKHQRNNSYALEKPIQTENHEIVRSKSEKIIADKLKLMGVPYKYEEALILGEKTIFPDFTVLNKNTRKQYYWEHFGMMDDPEYVEKAMKKIELYHENNIVLGDNLIVTLETSNHTISLYVVEGLIQKHLTSVF